jgi:hypothetical protein
MTFIDIPGPHCDKATTTPLAKCGGAVVGHTSDDLVRCPQSDDICIWEDEGGSLRVPVKTMSSNQGENQ